jgi:hypothetical protein
MSLKMDDTIYIKGFINEKPEFFCEKISSPLLIFGDFLTFKLVISDLLRLIWLLLKENTKLK